MAKRLWRSLIDHGCKYLVFKKAERQEIFRSTANYNDNFQVAATFPEQYYHKEIGLEFICKVNKN